MGAPPLTPEQVQVQGPVPITAEAVPKPQRSVVGVAVNVCPLDLPQVLKVIVSVQLLVIAPVVYANPLIEPPHVPLTLAVYPGSAVSVNVVAEP